MASRTVNILGLCSGLGWLELAACETFRCRGYAAQCVCHCERDAVTAALLASMPDEARSEAPIWDDMATFDGKPWRGVVDCIVAGLPCPAFSVAGKRRGNDDARAWGSDDNGPQRHFLRIAGEILPEYLFLENVPQYVAGGHFRRLGEGLLELGYRILPAVFLSAGDVGATQIRERVFILAVREDAHRGRELQSRKSAADGRSGLAGRGAELGIRSRGGQRADGRAPRDAGYTEQPSGYVGGAVGLGRREDLPRRGQGRRAAIGRAGAGMGDGTGERCEIERLPKSGTGEIVGLFPPGRGHWTDPEWQRVLSVAPALAPATEPGFSVVAHGLAVAASDLLRIGGNGVVPLAAAVALDFLLDQEGI